MKFSFRNLAVVAALLLVLTAATALGFGPSTVSYQGRLTNSSGQPLNGTFQVKFAIYADPGGPFPAGWQETQSVTCVDGFFTTLLGATTPISSSVFYYPQPYLGITVGADPELQPRRKLAASMFALRVKTVDGAQGGSINGNIEVGDYSTGSTGVSAGGGYRGGTFVGSDASNSTAGVEGFISFVVSDYDAIGVLGSSVTGDGWGIGGKFTGGYFGVQATAVCPNASTGAHYGVISNAEGYAGTGTNVGVYGSAGGAYYNYGVQGYAYHNGTPGALAYGVYGSAAFNDGAGAWAGYFNGWTTCNGTLEVIGTLYKPGGAFRIDHPLDPENKYLQHSFVESPDMKNIYDGVVTTDLNGEATVTMPDWFDALNRDFRYQLTVIGQFAQAIVAEELANGRFAIKTDKPNVKVSWQVTGIRHDAYANAHRIETEVNKKPQEVGRYLDPVAFGKPAELQLHYEMNKAMADQRKVAEARAAKMNESRKK